jgi:hypothetical protein
MSGEASLLGTMPDDEVATDGADAQRGEAEARGDGASESG